MLQIAPVSSVWATCTIWSIRMSQPGTERGQRCLSWLWQKNHSQVPPKAETNGKSPLSISTRWAEPLGKNPLYDPMWIPHHGGEQHRLPLTPAALPVLEAKGHVESADCPGARTVRGRCLLEPSTIRCVIPRNLRASFWAAWADLPRCIAAYAVSVLDQY